MDFTGNWVVTDPSSNQQGRLISPSVYEFKEDAVSNRLELKPRIINLSKFKQDTIERALSGYGYVLHSPKQNEQCLYDIYKTNQEVDWIVAECLFELETPEGSK